MDLIRQGTLLGFVPFFERVLRFYIDFLNPKP